MSTPPDIPSTDAPGDSVPVRYQDLNWRQRLEHVVDTLREISSMSDPQQVVRAYAKRMRGTITRGHTIALSRRGLSRPMVRMTRNTQWAHQPDPWRDTHALPLLEGGLFAELIYADRPRILAPLVVARDDPAFPYLEHARSAVAIPHYENGEGLNMVLMTSFDAQPLDAEKFPDLVLQSNLFGRATKNLVLTRELREAYESLDRELRIVQDIQLSLLPRELPSMPTLELGSHYQTSQRAGGDYYDFFTLPGDRLGILVGDVSGHGTPAAVLMAIVHAVAHLMPGDPCPPDHVLRFVNTHLCGRYTRETGNFVTMFYGIYDSRDRTLTYANAGHPEPLIRRADGQVEELAHPGVGLPLGIMDANDMSAHRVSFSPGEAFIVYTDGITEAFNVHGDMFGDGRLRRTIAQSNGQADDIVSQILSTLGDFAGLANRNDDRTLVVGAVK